MAAALASAWAELKGVGWDGEINDRVERTGVPGVYYVNNICDKLLQWLESRLQMWFLLLWKNLKLEQMVFENEKKCSF